MRKLAAVIFMIILLLILAMCGFSQHSTGSDTIPIEHAHEGGWDSYTSTAWIANLDTVKVDTVRDTIPCIMMVCDTASPLIYWLKGYGVSTTLKPANTFIPWQYYDVHWKRLTQYVWLMRAQAGSKWVQQYLYERD